MWVSFRKAQTRCALCGRVYRKHSGVTHHRWTLLIQNFRPNIETSSRHTRSAFRLAFSALTSKPTPRPPSSSFGTESNPRNATSSVPGSQQQRSNDHRCPSQEPRQSIRVMVLDRSRDCCFQDRSDLFKYLPSRGSLLDVGIGHRSNESLKFGRTRNSRPQRPAASQEFPHRYAQRIDIGRRSKLSARQCYRVDVPFSAKHRSCHLSERIVGSLP